MDTFPLILLLLNLYYSYASIPTNGLIAFWSFDNSSALGKPSYGGAWLNSYGSPSYSANGKYGGAISFDGASYLYKTDPTAFLPCSSCAYTLAAWVKFSSVPTSGVVSFIAYGTTTEDHLQLLGDDTPYNRYLVNAWYGDDLGYGTNFYTANTWHHVAATWDGTYRKLYVDGAVVASESHTSPPNFDLVNFNIGAALSNGGSAYWGMTGLMDEVAIYNRGLSQAEIQNLIMTLNPPPAEIPLDGLIAFWDFDDSTALGKPSYGGATLSSYGSPSYSASGKYGGAISFDGSSYLYKSNPSAFVPCSSCPYTFATWVKFSTVPTSGTSSLIASGIAFSNQGHVLGISPGYSNYLFDSWTSDDLYYTTNFYSANTWIHVASTWDGATRKLYVNGAVVATESHSTAPNFYIDKFNIGDAFRDGEGSYWGLTGMMDEVAIYNRGLSQAEIQDLIMRSPTSQPSQQPTSQPTNVHIPEDGLLAFWNFDDSTALGKPSYGGAWLNTYGSPSFTSSGKNGGAVSFDGSSYLYARFPSAFLPCFDCSYTLAAWVKFTTIPSSGLNCFISYGIGASYRGHVFCEESDSRWLVDAWTADDLSYYTNFYSANTWVHVATTWDGTTRKLFVNGVVVSTDNPSFDSNFDMVNFNIGAAFSNGGSAAYWGFNGLIDEVAIYNRGLSLAEIDRLIMTGNPPTAEIEDGLLALWTFDDSTALGKPSYGGAWLNSYGSPSFSLNGKVSGAISLDGLSYLYKTAASSFLPCPSCSYTLAAWVQYATLPTSDLSSYIAYGISTQGEGQVFGNDANGRYLVDGWYNYDDLGYTTNFYSANKWFHVAASWNGTTRALYVNGALVASESHPAAPNFNLINFNIGAALSSGSSPTWPLSGLIDNVAIYNRGLSRSEIQDLAMTLNLPPAEIPGDGLLAFWDFDDSTALGQPSFGGATLSSYGSPSYSANGKYGGALSLDGSSYLYSRTASFLPCPNCAYTLAAWVKFTTIPESGLHCFISYGFGAQDRGHLLCEETNDRWLVDAWMTYDFSYYTNFYTANTWVHVAATWDGAYRKLYVNGAVVASESRTTPPSFDLVNFDIGAALSYGGAPQWSMNGLMDEVAIYSRGLSQAEIQDLMMRTPTSAPSSAPTSSPSSAPTSLPTSAPTIPPSSYPSLQPTLRPSLVEIPGDGLLAFWDFDDSAALGQPSYGGATLISYGSPSYSANGKYGGALSLDGSSYLYKSNPSSFLPCTTCPYTLAAWVKFTTIPANSDLDCFISYGNGGVNQVNVLCEESNNRWLVNAWIGDDLSYYTNIYTANTWVHVAATWDGAYRKLYVNGAVVASESHTAVPNFGLVNFNIGASMANGGAPQWSMNGLMDEVAIYSRGLSQAEIQDLMMRTPTSAPSSAPTSSPSSAPTSLPTSAPTIPTSAPSSSPSSAPTISCPDGSFYDLATGTCNLCFGPAPCSSITITDVYDFALQINSTLTSLLESLSGPTAVPTPSPTRKKRSRPFISI